MTIDSRDLSSTEVRIKSLGVKPDEEALGDVPVAESSFATPDQSTRDSENLALAVSAHKYGFRFMTLEHYQVQPKKQFPHLFALAKDIPHELQDRFNSLPGFARRADNMQLKLFEAMMIENTASDEPHAPPIHIINDVDDELTPPYEFHYSNIMWHGEGVPILNWNNLRGCDCIGPCDPDSKTCSCAQRQRQYCAEHNFLYDEEGRLALQEYPIFECNELCRCSDECINRVSAFLWQNTRFSFSFVKGGSTWPKMSYQYSEDKEQGLGLVTIKMTG